MDHNFTTRMAGILVAGTAGQGIGSFRIDQKALVCPERRRKKG